MVDALQPVKRDDHAHPSNGSPIVSLIPDFRPRACGRRTYRASARSFRCGAVCVEFAVIAPILFLTIFGCIEFVRLAMLRNLAQDAAYEAARHSMVLGGSTEDAVAKAQSVLAWLGTRNAEIVVNDGHPLTAEDEFVTVFVSIPWRDNSFIPIQFVTDRQITAEVRLVTERYDGYFNAQSVH